jgi:hypothetical protein
VGVGVEALTIGVGVDALTIGVGVEALTIGVGVDALIMGAWLDVNVAPIASNNKIMITADPAIIALLLSSIVHQILSIILSNI